MRLAIVQLRDKVPTGAPGDNTARLLSCEGPNASQGWDLVADFDKRVVFATKGGRRIIIPFENTPHMEPEAPVAPAAKGKAA